MRVINFEDGFTSSSEPTVDQDAASVSVTPSGNISSTNVAAALVELQGDIDQLNSDLSDHVADTANPHAVTKSQVGLGNVLNAEQVPASEKAQANGVATLDSGGRVPMSQLPDVIVGAVHYLGIWNGTSNTPTLADGTGEKGGYYVVATAGSTSIDGTTDWKVGDWIIFNGTIWEKIDNTESVVSVNGQTGVVVLAKSDVGLGNVDDTSDATKNAATANLTNKTIVEPVLDNFVDFNQESTPATPGASKLRVWAGTDGKLYTKDPNGTVVQVGAGGSGEINMVETGTQDATGWTAESNMAVATTTTAAQCPLSPIVDTAIRVTRTSGTNSVYHDFDVPAALMNRKHKIEWHGLPDSGYASGDLKLVLKSFTDQARTTSVQTYVLSTDSSSVTAIPNATGKFTTYFDADDRVYYRLYLTGVAGTTPYNLTNLIVGPGVQPQGAVVGPWQDFTPTWTNLTVSDGTQVARWRQVGDSIEVQQTLTWGSTTSIPSGTVLIIPPSNLTPVYASSTSLVIGTARLSDSGTAGNSQTGVVHLNTSSISIQPAGSNSALNSTTPFTWASGDIIRLDYKVQIAQWVGSGTVNLAQNDVEYAYNSSTSTSTDSTSFGYGPSGAAVQAFAPSATASIQKRVRFQSPIQVTDSLTLELQTADGIWIPASAISNYIGLYDGTTQRYVGALIYSVSGSTTDVDVYFYSGAFWQASDSTLRTWSELSSSYPRWRVKKAAGGQAVGFGEAADGALGLVKVWKGSVSAAFTFSGSGGTSSSVTVAVRRVDDWVTVFIPAVTATTGTGSTQFTASAVLPTWARPLTASANTPCNSIKNNGSPAASAGILSITTGGSLIFLRDASQTAWTNAASGGTATNYTFSYYVGTGS